MKKRNVENIVTKMFHARVGVLTKKFSEETTSKFANQSQNWAIEIGT